MDRSFCLSTTLKFAFFQTIFSLLYTAEARVTIPENSYLAKGGTCIYGNATDTCNIGHCCPNNECCRRYYEHWWFWCIWVVVIVLCCCCFYHHQRRNQNPSHNLHHNNRHDGVYAGVCNYPGPPVDKEMLGYCKLPKYNEVIRIPPSGSPPPPYSERRIFQSIARMPSRTDMGLQIMQQNDLTSSVMSLVTSAFNLNFRGSSTIVSSPDSNQDVMDSISELDTFHTQENLGALLHSPTAIHSIAFNQGHNETLPKKCLFPAHDDPQTPPSPCQAQENTKLMAPEVNIDMESPVDDDNGIRNIANDDDDGVELI